MITHPRPATKPVSAQTGWPSQPRESVKQRLKTKQYASSNLRTDAPEIPAPEWGMLKFDAPRATTTTH